MIMELYAVYDSKLGGYLAPFTTSNHSTAIRQFETAVMQEDHDFNIHSEDYSLWHLARYDAEHGTLKIADKVCISHAHEILAHLLQRGPRNEIS